MATGDASICVLLEDRNEQFVLQSLLEASGRSVRVAKDFEEVRSALGERPGLVIASASALPAGALARLNQADPSPAVLLLAGDDEPLFQSAETLDTLAGSVSSSVAILHRPARRSTVETVVRLVADLLDRSADGLKEGDPGEPSLQEERPHPSPAEGASSNPPAARPDESSRRAAPSPAPGVSRRSDRPDASVEDSAGESSGDEWRTVLERMGMGVIHRRSVAAPIRLSPKVRQLTGLSNPMWTATRLLRRVDRRDRERLISTIRSAFFPSPDPSASDDEAEAASRTVDCTVRLDTNPSATWVRIRLGTAADPFGGTLESASGWRAVLEDVTENRERRRDRKETIDDLQTTVARSGHRVRRLAEQLVDAEETERQRIASVLHDDLQPLIYGAQVQLETLQEEIADGTVQVEELPEDAAPPAEQLNDLTIQLQQAVSLTRSLISNIRPPVLHSSTFAETLQWLSVRVEETLGADLVLNVPDALEIEGRGRRAFLFEAIRESVFNAVRHGNADEVVVRAGQTEDRVVVAIEDEGDGFDVDALDGRESGNLRFGLRSIRQRCDDLGGVFRIHSAPGVGTRVTLALPRGQEPALEDGEGGSPESSAAETASRAST
jgi:signal transduction histidine kinase